MMAKKYNPVKVITGVVRLLNANIWEPLEVPDRGSIYTATILIPKNDSKTVLGINTAIQGAFAVGRLARKGHVGRNPMQNYPLHDGDDGSLPTVFNGCYYINAIFRPRASRVGCMLGNIQKARISDSYEALPDAGFENCLDDYLLIFDKGPG